MDNKIYTEEQLTAFERGWCDMMVDIWRERQMSLGIYDTGTLSKSVSGSVSLGTTHTITHHFAEYGIYVAAGVGNGYRRGNSGKDDENGLQFLRGDKGEYRKKKHRKRRDWFTPKYFYSMMRLNEKEAEFYGEAYQGYMSTFLDELFQGTTDRLRSL